jgi:CRISPR/Cas system-associated exonuclease Cas4 (RecB family)
MQKHLSKTDFSRWMTCPTAAYYGWSGLESKNDNDTFLHFLADEGKTVGRMAQRLFSNGEHIPARLPLNADMNTRSQLKQEHITLFESCIIQDDFVIRPDVLIRKNRTLYIIEVKSKVGNMQQHRDGKMLINYYGDVRAAFREIVYDLSFQVEVLNRAFPDFDIIPYFLLPEGASLVHKEETEAARKREEIVAENIPNELLNKRRAKSVLKFFPATTAIDKIQATTSATMDAMHTAWKSDTKPKAKLRYQCRNCEFRLQNGNDSTDGFHQCWGKLAESTPNIFDLFQLYSLKVEGKGQALLADSKISQSKTSLYSVQESDLHGEHAARQSIQLQHQKANTEWLDPRLNDEIDALEWPIAFLDFETTMAGIPWYEGLKPYEVLPFEFSCHILHSDGHMEHRHWLNTEDRIPTLPFIRELMSTLDGIGSVLVYTDYEERVLNNARSLLDRLEPNSAKERVWIYDLLNSGRIVDQHDWVHKYYFHPRMSGKTSIKKVLPAVWESNPALHRHEYFKRYLAKSKSGELLDPYESLPSESVADIDIAVKEGCGAMSAYRELIRGVGSTEGPTRNALKDVLERYVTLDTASQWMLFEHWRQRLEIM